jgi:hypothetical protein
MARVSFCALAEKIFIGELRIRKILAGSAETPLAGLTAKPNCRDE